VVAATTTAEVAAATTTAEVAAVMMIGEALLGAVRICAS
jgi:hypothetical protein